MREGAGGGGGRGWSELFGKPDLVMKFPNQSNTFEEISSTRLKITFSKALRSTIMSKKHVTLEDDNRPSAKKTYQQVFYQEKRRTNYSHTLANDDSIYIVERYYHYNKSIPNLKYMLVRVQNAKTKQYEAYMRTCV